MNENTLVGSFFFCFNLLVSQSDPAIKPIFIALSENYSSYGPCL